VSFFHSSPPLFFLSLAKGRSLNRITSTMSRHALIFFYPAQSFHPDSPLFFLPVPRSLQPLLFDGHPELGAVTSRARSLSCIFFFPFGDCPGAVPCTRSFDIPSLHAISLTREPGPPYRMRMPRALNDFFCFRVFQRCLHVKSFPSVAKEGGLGARASVFLKVAPSFFPLLLF